MEKYDLKTLRALEFPAEKITKQRKTKDKWFQ